MDHSIPVHHQVGDEGERLPPLDFHHHSVYLDMGETEETGS
jgi:hypothetical protein